MGSDQSRTDISCEYLQKLNFMRISIVDEIKTRAEEGFGWDNVKTTRINKKILKAVEDCGNKIEDGYWINLLKDHIVALEGSSVVIPDVRTVEEMEAIKSLGGIILYVGQKQANFKNLPDIDCHIQDTGRDAGLMHSTMLCLIQISEDPEFTREVQSFKAASA